MAKRSMVVKPAWVSAPTRRLLRDGIGPLTKKEIKSPAEAGLPSGRKRRPKRDHHSLAESSRCFHIDLAYIPVFSDPKAQELERSSSPQLDSFRLRASATSANGLNNAPVISAPEKRHCHKKCLVSGGAN